MCREEWHKAKEAEWLEQRGAGTGKKRGREERTVEAARLRYSDAVKEAAEVSRKGVSTGFEEEREKTFEEFRGFLEEIGCGDCREASGVDVVAFIQGWWMKRHAGNFRTVVPGSGERVASASAVKGVMNPAKAEAARSYREGYRTRLRELGVKERRAKIMGEEKVERLVAHLRERLEQETGIQRCVVAMDMAAVTYLWETWARGKECGEVEAGQVNREAGLIRPGWSKTVKENPSCEIKVSEEGKPGSFLWAAAILVNVMEKSGNSVGEGFLFRPLNKKKDGFVDQALSAGAMNRRIQKQMQSAGLHEGETLHSFRRSAVQHAAQIEGYNVARLMERGRWKSKAAFRIYVEEIAGGFGRGEL